MQKVLRWFRLGRPGKAYRANKCKKEQRKKKKFRLSIEFARNNVSYIFRVYKFTNKYVIHVLKLTINTNAQLVQ